MSSDALSKAFADAERSYLHSKQAVADISSDLLARGPSGGLLQRADMSKAAEQLKHFRGWVYSAIRPIGQTIAGQPIYVGKARSTSRRAGGAKQLTPDADPLPNHPILDMLADPNDLMVAWSLMYVTICSLELTGAQLWWCPLQDGRRRVYPIPTSWIEATEGATSFERWLIRPPSYAGDPLPIDADDAVWFSYPHPGDPHASWSPLQAAAAAVDADDNIVASQGAMFRNGIHPSHAIIIGDEGESGKRPRLTGPQEQQLIRAIRQRYSGAMLHGDPLILDSMIADVKKLSNTPAEMDWLNSGKVTKERIFLAFGTNPIVAGQVESVNRASSLAAQEHFAQFTVNPKIMLLSQCLTEWLRPMFGDDKLVVWIEPFVPRDWDLELKKWQLLVTAGAADMNEMRAAFGFKSIDIGDRMIKAVNRLMYGPTRTTEPSATASNGNGRLAGCGCK